MTVNSCNALTVPAGIFAGCPGVAPFKRASSNFQGERAGSAKGNSAVVPRNGVPAEEGESPEPRRPPC